MKQGLAAFVGRVRELERAQSALDAVAAGVPRALEVRGDPGVGKTRLLEAVAELARRRGQLVLSGRASLVEQDLHLGVFVDALDEHLRAMQPRCAALLGASLASELGRLFPGLDAPDGDSGSLLDERYRAHHAVRGLLERSAETQPVVLLLDDVHCADPASIELISSLLRRPPQAAVLLAIALRPHPCNERLAAALANSATATALERIELSAMSVDEAEQLLSDRAPTTTISAWHRATGGNPFYLEQLAKTPATAAEPGPPRADIVRPAVPAAVTASVSREVSQLSGDARLVVRAAAIAGDPFEPELAAAGAGCDVALALRAIDELLLYEIVIATAAPRAFRFRCPIVRWAIYESTPAGWRLAAHERAERALAARGAPPLARAHHVEHSARSGDRMAIEVLRSAGRAAAPDAAARWLRAALRLFPDERSADRGEVLSDLARALAAGGRLSESRLALLDLLDVAPGGDQAIHVGRVRCCATIEQLLGRHAVARQRLATTLDALEDQRSPEAALLMVGLSETAFFTSEHRQMLEWGERALSLARVVGDRPLMAAAGGIVAWAARFEGDLALARTACDEAAAIIDELTDRELASRIDGAAYAAWSEWSLERYDESLRHSERGSAVARASGDGEIVPLLTQARVCSLLMRDPTRARELQGLATEAARHAGTPLSVAWALMTEAWIAHTTGDAGGALSAAAECVERTRGLEVGLITLLGELFLVVSQLEAGEAPDHDRLRPPRAPLVVWSLYNEVLTRARLRQGRLEDARKAARDANDVAVRLGLCMPACWAQRAQASVLLAEGEPAAARSAAFRSAANAEAVGAHVEGARSRMLAARASARVGERERAASELRAAAGTFDLFGATRLRDEAERELRRLGRRFRRMPRSDAAGVASLTPRELDVARLVAQGQTNREIAGQLFVSEKTIESHMRSIFGKLGISSRGAIAPALEARMQARP